MKGYADLADLKEDERISVIGKTVMNAPASSADQPWNPVTGCDKISPGHPVTVAPQKTGIRCQKLRPKNRDTLSKVAPKKPGVRYLCVPGKKP
jgi:hypothetical protein